VFWISSLGYPRFGLRLASAHVRLASSGLGGEHTCLVAIPNRKWVSDIIFSARLLIALLRDLGTRQIQSELASMMSETDVLLGDPFFIMLIKEKCYSRNIKWLFATVIPHLRRRFEGDNRFCQVMAMAKLWAVFDDTVSDELQLTEVERIKGS
jgi:hypothetical protein